MCLRHISEAQADDSLQLISGAFEHSVLRVQEIYGLYDP